MDMNSKDVKCWVAGAIIMSLEDYGIPTYTGEAGGRVFCTISIPLHGVVLGSYYRWAYRRVYRKAYKRWPMYKAAIQSTVTYPKLLKNEEDK
jgi:hypothetical protein